MSIRVFIADDHGILRGGLRALINAQTDMEVVGEAVSGPDAESGVKETEPDVLLMDISMPRGGGLAAIAAIKSVRPRTRIVPTVHDELDVRAAADECHRIRREERRGHGASRRFARSRKADLHGHLRGPGLSQSSMSRRDEEGGREATQLTGREREVMARVAEGFTNSQIAEELGLGVKSVETHRARVMEKLGLTSRSDLVRLGARSRDPRRRKAGIAEWRASRRRC